MGRLAAFFRGWAVGVVIGGSLALLFAPERGEVTRQHLQAALKEAWEEVRRAAEAEQQRLERELRRLRGEEE